MVPELMFHECGVLTPFFSGPGFDLLLSAINQWYQPPCLLYVCATEKGVSCCFECDDFPCRNHYEEVKVYDSEALDVWKELMEKPIYSHIIILFPT